MIKNIICLTFLWLTCSSFDCQPIHFEGRIAAYIPEGNRFREVYGNVGTSYQLEASTRITRNWEGFINFDWYSKKGRSDGFSNPTRINMATISIGVEYPFQLSDKFAAYIGGGPAVSGIWIKDKFELAGSHKVRETGFGALLKSGIYVTVSKSVFLDFFVDYFFQGAGFKRHAQVGGIKTGVGVGFTL